MVRIKIMDLEETKEGNFFWAALGGPTPGGGGLTRGENGGYF